MTHGQPAELPTELLGVGQAPEPEPLTVLVYSDDAAIRRQVIMALGPRPAKDIPPVTYVEVAT